MKTSKLQDIVVSLIGWLLYSLLVKTLTIKRGKEKRKYGLKFIYDGKFINCQEIGKEFDELQKYHKNQVHLVKTKKHNIRLTTMNSTPKKVTIDIGVVKKT